MAVSAESNPTSTSTPASTGFGDVDQMVQTAGAAGGAGFSSGAEPELFAYLGVTPRTARGRQTTSGMKDNQAHSMFGGTDRIVGVDNAAMQAYSWSDKQFDAWAHLLVDEGLLRPGQYNREQLIAEWGKAVMGSAGAFAAGKKVTPEDYVRIYSGLKGVTPISQARTVKRSDSTVQDFSDLDARAMAREVGQSLLGEDPGGKFSAALEAALDAYATNHPQITNSTSRYNDNGDLVDTDSHVSGGVSNAAAQTIAEDQAMANPGYAEHQASTTLFNWLIQGIQSPVDV